MQLDSLANGLQRPAFPKKHRLVSKIDQSFVSALLFPLVRPALASLRFDSFPKGDDMRNLPKPIGHASGHRRRGPQLRVYLDEIVIHHMKRHGISMVLELFSRMRSSGE